jgi:hypothetical protein
MHESICKCFTGRISRLINCLNGFDELVNIKIAGNEQISQIISLIQNKLEKEGIYNIKLHKEQVKNSLIELNYDSDIINELIILNKKIIIIFNMQNEICIKIISKSNNILHLFDFDIETNNFNIKIILSNKKIINIKNNNYFNIFLIKGINYIIIFSNDIIKINKLNIIVGNKNIAKLCDISLKQINFKQIIQKNNEYDFFKETVNNDMLDKIYNNIDIFIKQIKPYKKILFLCSDYPDFGGAATNCYDLCNFFTDHENYSIFYSKYKNYKNDLYSIVHPDNLVSELENLSFKPNIIILKNYLPNNIIIKKYFSCPIIFLIPGIFKDSLDMFYTNFTTKSEHDLYIETQILDTIKISDFNYCNSYNTKNILYKYYNIETNLFYSTFIKFYNKKIDNDINFENRKYNYALIISDFNRTIKNVNDSINFLKNKKDVILIGKNSNKYEFTCVDLIENKEVTKILKDIKYIVQTSFYESCSNIKIEAMFCGCKMVNLMQI